MIPGSANPLLLRSAAATGYQIQRSLRFNSSDSAYLSRTPASAGNRKTWTWAGWVKRSALGSNQALFGAFGSGIVQCIFASSDVLRFQVFTGSNYVLDTTQVFRDCSAWYHIVVAFDSTQSTASDRTKLYVNGSQVTALTGSYAPQNTDGVWNNAIANNIGQTGESGYNYYLNGYLADIYFIDGQALTPSSFTEVSATTGQLIPKAYTGSYGTNGFRLPFSDNSTAAALGTDISGNGNNWVAYNLSVSTGASFNVLALSTSSGASLTSVASLSSLGSGVKFFTSPSTPINCLTADFGVVSTYSIYSSLYDPAFNGEIAVSNDGTNWTSIAKNQRPFVFTGRYIQWAKADAGYSSARLNTRILRHFSDSTADHPLSSGADSGAGGQVGGNYATWNPLVPSGGTTLSDGNTRVDSDTNTNPNVTATIAVSSGKWYWEHEFAGYNGYLGVGIMNITGIAGNNNTSAWAGADPANTTTPVYGLDYQGRKWSPSGKSQAYTTAPSALDAIGVAFDATNGTLEFFYNGVSQGIAFTGIPAGTYLPIFTARENGAQWWGAGEYFVSFGQRPFAYAAPSGFKALCDTNLPAPVVAKPSTVMDVALWTGNGSARSITGLGFSPDFVWIKGRSGATDHALYDAVRGATIDLVSNSTAAETTQTQGLTAFNSDGFSLGTLAKVNTNSATYAGWAWDAGTTTSSNGSGSITSQVRANASSGFSVVSWSGVNGANGTIGHGLGVAPQFAILKNRGTADNWRVYHVSVGATGFLQLASTGATVTSDEFQNTSPTSSVFYLRGNTWNAASNNYIGYFFAPVAGYSSGFSYTGNGSTDGVFVYLGLRAKLLLIKRTNATGNWYLWDTVRNTYNVVGEELYPNLSNAAATATDLDILSNGFKMRSTAADFNASGGTYIGFAWAEAPFAYSRAR